MTKIKHTVTTILTLVFLLDKVGANQDGTINDGDPIAIFQDPNATLESISANTEISVEDINVSLDLDDPRAGTARVESESNIIVTQRPRESEDPLGGAKQSCWGLGTVATVCYFTQHESAGFRFERGRLLPPWEREPSVSVL